MALPSGASKRGDGVPHWNVALATGPPSTLQGCQCREGRGRALRDEEDQEGQSRKQTSAGHGRPMVADSRDGGKGFGL